MNGEKDASLPASRHLVLHLGAHRTGTTVLQQRLLANRRELLEAGIDFPEAGQEEWQHAPLFVNAEYGRWQNVDALLGEISRASGPRSVVLSSEGAQWLRPDGILELCKRIGRHFGEHRITVIYYVRRQDLFFESFYSQQVRTGTLTDDFHTFFFANQWLGMYHQFLSAWRRAPEVSEVIVRNYDDMRRSKISIVDDFLSALAGTLKLPPLPTKSYEIANEALAPEMIQLKRLMNKFTRNKDRQFIRTLAQIVSDVSRDVHGATQQSSSYLRPLERMHVINCYRQENERLFADFFNSPNSYAIDERSLSEPENAVRSDQNAILASFLVHFAQYIQYELGARRK